MEFDLQTIKDLREETGAGVMDVKNALESAKGNVEEAKKILGERGISKAQKRQDRETSEGVIYSYIHHSSKLASMVMLTCETDFVAKNEEFIEMAKKIAMQCATQEYENIEDLLNAPYILDESVKVSELITRFSGKTGEKIELKKFVRFAI